MILPRTIVFCITLLVITINIEHSLSCLCKLIKFKCPAPPTCCESGQYALDECGCCLKCAKAELQTCGGANDISGRCGSGLQCLKTCLPCKTVGDAGKPCIFPFQYAGRTYDKCTTRDSDNGQPWCATQVDTDGYVVDNAWGDCLEGCPGTRVECDDKYFSIQEGKCIDVSVPGAIPNWFGAPAVKLLDSTVDLVSAPVCRSKGAAVRLYDNTCRCVRGETAVDFDLRGMERGNCTGLEDNHHDNLDKVWCFLENIRDPFDPNSGCYSDTKWSERDGRFWSSLACFQAPDIEGGNNPAVHPGNVNRPKSSRRPPTTRRTTRRTTRSTTTTTTTTTTTQPTTTTTIADYGSENGHTFNFTYDYDYIDYEEYNEEDEDEVISGPQTPSTIESKPQFTEQVDRGFEFLPGETNLPGFEMKPQLEIIAENNEAEEENIADNEITTEYLQDTIDIEEATETVEIGILDDLNELINEINQQSGSKDTENVSENEVDNSVKFSSSLSPSDANGVEEVFLDLVDLNVRIPPNLTPSSTPTSTNNKPTSQNKTRPRKVPQPKRKKENIKQPTTTPVTKIDENATTEPDKPSTDGSDIITQTEIPTTTTEIPTTTTEILTSTTTTQRRKTKPRKRSHRNKQRKVSRKPKTTTTNSPTTDNKFEPTTSKRVGPETLQDSEYELYTDQESNAPTTIAPNFFFGININL